MLTTTRLTASAIALLAGISLAHAQPAQLATSIIPIPKRKPLTRPHPCRHRVAGRPGRVWANDGRRHGSDDAHVSGMMPREGGGMDMMPGQHVEGRVAYLKAELGITDAQLPQWNAFADAMRNGAKTMQSAMAANMGQGIPATAPARSDAMIAMMTGPPRGNEGGIRGSEQSALRGAHGRAEENCR